QGRRRSGRLSPRAALKYEESLVLPVPVEAGRPLAQPSRPVGSLQERPALAAARQLRAPPAGRTPFSPTQEQRRATATDGRTRSRRATAGRRQGPTATRHSAVPHPGA